MEKVNEKAMHPDKVDAAARKRRSVPSSAYDKEYMTEWHREFVFLRNKGILPSYVKRTPKYRVRQYKYTKTPELFLALYDFYSQLRRSREFNRLGSVLNDSTCIPDWATETGESPVA